MQSVKKKLFLIYVISLLLDCICHEVKRFIACQFALESNFGQSSSSCCYNNFSGMKVANFRITLARNLSEVGKFAQFSGNFSCVMDYLLWLQSNRFSRQELNDLFMFKKHLDMAGYCPDLGYFDKINSIYSQYYE